MNTRRPGNSDAIRLKPISSTTENTMSFTVLLSVNRQYCDRRYFDVRH